MSGAAADERLLRLRLANQRLAPDCHASGPIEAARAVLGIQAQDVRAAGLAIRSRVPGVTREAIDHALLVRTWTVRGTAHLLAADDLSWLDALTGPRNRRRFDGLMTKRGNLEIAREIFPTAIELLGEGPMTRAALIDGLERRGAPSLGPYSVNILMPWLATSGRVLGLADGSFRAVDPPPPVAEDEALEILGRRYLEGYGPAGAADMARWSGLPVTLCRRALGAIGPLESVGELLALPGTMDRKPPAPPSAQLLAAFDTSMLGWHSREPLIAAADGARIGGGGGMIRAVVMSFGRGVGVWRLSGSGHRRALTVEWFGAPVPQPELGPLEAEVADVGRYLELDLHLAS